MGGMRIVKARDLRKDLTIAERTLWKHLRLRQLIGHKFRRQSPIGPYIVDFVCFEKGLIIELDGGQHSEQQGYDSERTTWLESQGFRVIRFWNDRVVREIEGVKELILEALGLERDDHPLSDSPPSRGRELWSVPTQEGKKKEPP